MNITKEQVEDLLITLEHQGIIKQLSSDNDIWEEGIDVGQHVLNGGKVDIKWVMSKGDGSFPRKEVTKL